MNEETKRLIKGFLEEIRYYLVSTYSEEEHWEDSEEKDLADRAKILIEEVR